MARKTSKKPSRERQMRRQRRATKSRKRKERARRSPQSRVHSRPDEIIEDMLPLFPLLEDGASSSATDMDQFMMILLDSADLIEEPEFEEIIIDPMYSVKTFAEVAQELDIDTGALGDSFDEERDDALAEALEITTQRLLTDGLRRDIVSALNKLRLRLKRAGKQEEAARVAALQSFLREGEADAGMWSLFGLVQAIVSRSVTAGLAFFDVSMELTEAAHLGEDDTPLTFSQRLTQSPLVKKTETLVRKTPGLRGYLEKQADKAWEELEVVWAREMVGGSYRARWVKLQSVDGPIRALTFVVNRDHPRYAGDIPRDVATAYLATAAGPLGSCAEYLINTVSHLDELGIVDSQMHGLLDGVRSFKGAPPQGCWEEGAWRITKKP